jgi:anaerobic ribonucleoside-triphosphate reductase
MVKKLQEAIYCGFSKYGLSYQKCRFCGASFDKVAGLWKYAVRHYICEECRNRKLKERL